MFAKEYNREVNIPKSIYDDYKMENVAYFDIETTGFDKINDSIILISFGSFTNYNNFHIKQYFAESVEDEIKVLFNFDHDIIKYNVWCSYNGIAFDEPFICERMIRANIKFQPPKHHIDLYRLVRPYYKQLGMERCNLKTVEKYMGIRRKDQIDGGISVDLYREFLNTQSEKLKNTIMLHNYEDVLNLPKIHELIYKIQNNNSLVRGDSITEKQLKFLTSLLNRNHIRLTLGIKKISKKSASKSINYILRGGRSSEEIESIVSSSY